MRSMIRGAFVPARISSSASNVGAGTRLSRAKRATRGMSPIASTRSLASATASSTLRPREGLADHHLGPVRERDRREQIAVTTQAEQRPFLRAGRRGDARRLLHAARDQRREQPRPRARLLREAHADREAADQRRAPLEAAQVVRAVDAERGVRHRGRDGGDHLGVVRSAHHRRGAALDHLAGLHGPAERPRPAHGRLGAHDVGDGLEGAVGGSPGGLGGSRPPHRVRLVEGGVPLGPEAADAVHEEVRAVQVIAERAQHLPRDRRRDREEHEPRPRDLGIVRRRADPVPRVG
jgi:hypothetical protein